MVKKPKAAGMDRYERKVVMIMAVILTATVLALFITSGLDLQASVTNDSVYLLIQQEAVLR